MPKQSLKSHNSQKFDLIKDMLMPNLLQILLYFLTSIVILAALNAMRFWDYLSNDPSGWIQSVDFFSSGINLDGILERNTAGRVGQMIVWGFVGVAIYIVVWFLKNIIVNLRNDIVADEYVHPHAYSRTKYWQSVISRKLLFIFVTSVLIFFVYILIQLTPLLMEYFYQMVVNFNTHNVLLGIAAVASGTLLFHILVSLCRLTIIAWRFIYADL